MEKNGRHETNGSMGVGVLINPQSPPPHAPEQSSQNGRSFDNATGRLKPHDVMKTGGHIRG